MMGLWTLALWLSGAQAQAQAPNIVGQLAQACQDAVRGLESAGKGRSCQRRPTVSPGAEFETAAVRTSNGRDTDVSVVPEEQLNSLFRFAASSGLPWRNRWLCSQRAHVLVHDLLRDKKVNAGKLMSKPARSAFGLFSGHIRPRFEDRERPRWEYHVAAFVFVRKEGVLEQWVIDPATFTRPVRRDEWERFQENLGQTYVTDRFALDLRDVDRTDVNTYSGHRALGHTRQVIEELRGRP